MASWVLHLAHNTYIKGKWWGKAPWIKIVEGTQGLVRPQRCQFLCVTPRQSWASHPQHCQARQTNLRHFRQNKPKKQRKTHCRPQEPNSASTGKTSPCVTPGFPLTPTTRAASWNPQHLQSRSSWRRAGALKGGWGSEGTWEAAGIELTPTPNACALAGTDVTLSGERKLCLKGAELQWELRWCQVHCVPSEQTPPLPKSSC